METNDHSQDEEADNSERAEVDDLDRSVIGKIGSKLKNSSESRTMTYMSAENVSDKVYGREKGKEVIEKGKQMDDSSNDDEEESVTSDLDKSLTSALKTPDVPRLVVPAGLLGTVLLKLGQKPDQAKAPLQVPESCT